jgi:hypothetical protein
MKVTALLLSLLFSGALAAPAIVWKNDATDSVIHSSEPVEASLLLSQVNAPRQESTLAAAIFLVDRHDDGSEQLSALASSGALPGVSSKYANAHSIHHAVTGLESPFKVAGDLKSAAADSSRVMKISLEEFNRKLASKDEDGHSQRSRALHNADMLVVDCKSRDAAKIDEAVVSAIESESVKNVILAGIRSIEETKDARRLLAMQKTPTTVNAPRRRLEDADEQNDDAAGNGNGDMEGVYYVYATPNIFAGILFILFFSFIAFTGINCMGQIAGQDVFVHKMPPVGREA